MGNAVLNRFRDQSELDLKRRAVSNDREILLDLGHRLLRKLHFEGSVANRHAKNTDATALHLLDVAGKAMVCAEVLLAEARTVDDRLVGTDLTLDHLV